MADRYTGRHQRQARHGAWVNKKRTRTKPSGQLLPAAAAFTVAGFLFGGAGAAIHFAPASSQDLTVDYDPADYMPPDRSAQSDQTSRDAARINATGADAAAPGTTTPREPAQLPANGIAAPLVPKQVVPATGATETVVATGDCQASYYEDGSTTASGEAFNPNELTAANMSLPFNSMVRVTNPANGQSVVVRINDRGPYYGQRCLDLSKGAFAAIADPGQGVVDVRYEVLAEDAT